MREIVIRLPVSPRKRWLAAGIAAIVATSALVYATVPNQFAPADTLSASKMNANFTALDTRVGAIEAASWTAIVFDDGVCWSNVTPSAYAKKGDLVYLR